MFNRSPIQQEQMEGTEEEIQNLCSLRSLLSGSFRHLLFLGSLCFLLFLLPLSVSRAASPLFEKDIRPILKAHCFDCHGEGEKLRGDVDLRLRRFMLKSVDDGPVLVPGKP